MRDNYIKNPEGFYWSNKLGWVDFKVDATLFTDNETQNYQLPIEGHWENDRGHDE